MPRVEWHGDRLAAAAKQAALEVARMHAEIVKGEAVNRAPLDEGALRGSAAVTDLEKGAEISFNTPYAVVMHESESYTPSRAGTGPGYLRQPFLEMEDQYHQNIMVAMKGIFG